MATITIDGEKYKVTEINTEYSYLPYIETESGEEFYLAESSEYAGEKSKEYWQDMIDNSPSEFRAMVGDENLIKWALGEYAGPGSEQVASLSDWLDLVAEHPEEEWASYDSAEREVNKCDKFIINKLGFTPTVAYRHN